MPVCFLKNVPKDEGLGKWKESEICFMLMSVLFMSKMLRRTIALKTCCCTVRPDIDFTMEERYFGERQSLSA